MAANGKGLKSISENEVKYAAVGFLKQYYRYRPRLGDTVTQFDQRGEGGIIVDGLVKYLVNADKGIWYTAAVEATSRGTKGEVYFRINNKVLFWDGLGVGVVMAAAFAIYSHNINYETADQIGFLLRFIWLGSIVLGTAFLYFLSFRKLKRYRYIYAIEQFKNYHASDQWIAIADDVFQFVEENPYLEELKRQCVYNGFGLVSILNDLRPILLIAPSREELFGLKRKRVNLLPLPEFVKNIPKQGKKLVDQVSDRLSKSMGNVVDPMKERFWMFQPSYYKQMIIGGIALLFIARILYVEWRNFPIAYANEQAYIRELIKLSEDNYPETTVVIFDVPVIAFADSIPPEWVGDDRIISVDKGKRDEVVVSTESGRRYIFYDCERIYNFDSEKYLIQAGSYSSVARARARMSDLSEKGLQVNILWEGCFSTREDYTVFIDEFYNNALLAQEEKARFENLAQDSTFVIRSLSPLKDE